MSWLDDRLAPHRPFFRSLIGQPLVQQNDSLVHAALENIRVHPARYGENVLANLSRMWFNFPYSWRQQGLTDLVFVLPNAIVLTALLAPLGLLATRRVVLPVEAFPFAMFALAGFLLHALLAAYPRMLFPLVPVIFWFIVIVLSSCVRIVPRARGS